MRTLHYRLIFVLIVPTLIMFLFGCGIDVPQEDDVYYGGSIYDPYYDAGSSPRAYGYDSSYDPWTVSTYYQYYIDVSGADASPGSSSTGGARSEGRRSFATGGDFTSVHQSRAPSSNEGTSLRRDRSAIRERRSTDSESSSSSITRQKARRDVRRGTSQTSQKSRAEQGEQRTQKTRREQVRSSKAGEEEKEKN